MTSMTTPDLEQLIEGHDLEAKLAAGRDRRGELPDGKLLARGITEPAKVVRALWDGLNNPQRVNANLLREQDVETLDVGARRSSA